MFDWTLALLGITWQRLPRTAVAELELSTLAPGELVTAWWGGDHD